MSKNNNKKSSREQTSENKKYPSAEFLYSVSLEDYNRVLSNYDKIYDRVNIALTLCGAVLIVFLANLHLTVFFEWCNYSKLEKMSVLLYTIFAVASAVLIIISVIKLLLLSCSQKLSTFDSNSIKEEELYEESVEDSALWVTLQYIRVINDIRSKTISKQKKLNTAIILIVISILSYVVSMLIYNGGLI